MRAQLVLIACVLFPHWTVLAQEPQGTPIGVQAGAVGAQPAIAGQITTDNSQATAANAQVAATNSQATAANAQAAAINAQAAAINAQAAITNAQAAVESVGKSIQGPNAASLQSANQPKAAVVPLEKLTVTDVWLKNATANNSSKYAGAYKALSRETEGNANGVVTEFQKLLDDLANAQANLKACEDARKCRNELATARATIALEPACKRPGFSGVFALELSKFDLMESNTVKFIGGNPQLLLQWEPINPDCQAQETPAPAPAPAPAPPKTPPIEWTGMGKQSVPATKPTPADDSPTTISGQLMNFTYEQPSLPWTITYEINGEVLDRWIHFGNLTEYAWKKGISIHLRDSDSSIEMDFALGEELGSNHAAAQKVDGLAIKNQTLRFDLTADQANPSAVLNLESGLHGVIEGRLRGQTRGAGYETSLLIDPKKKVVVVNSAPRYIATKNVKESSKELISFRVGRFKVASLRRETEVRIEDREVTAQPETQFHVEIPAERESWLPSGESPWKLNAKEDKYFVEAPALFPIELKLTEVRSDSNAQWLDFTNDADREILAKILKSDSPGDSHVVSLLQKAFSLSTAIAANQASIKDMETQIAALKKRYAATSESFQNVLIAIHREIEAAEQTQRVREPQLLEMIKQDQGRLDQLLSQEAAPVITEANQLSL